MNKITYAVKVEEKMTEKNPQYIGYPVVRYYYLGKEGWMAGQPLYEGYSTERGAKVALAAYKKQYKTPFSEFWQETVVGVVPMCGTEEVTMEEQK